ncbi:MAG: xanthine dehydrogenase family protein molybdopterin-binding subunit [Deltaproteobacteria bacterium]|nr:xanthine dehydrogenase family protein molybdopterin-binding subunit [Deltaproteobacteria bacterium]
MAKTSETVHGWQEQPRIDAKDKVTGQAKYIEDLPDLPGTAFAAPLISPYSHARILSIDSSRAAALPGVVGILDREHLNGFNPALPVPAPTAYLSWKPMSDESFIAVDKVRFDGELVALVAAEDLRTARRAIELIEVEYEVLPAVFDATEALSPGAPVLHESKGSNLLFEDKLEWGDVEEGFKQADRIFEETYSSPSMFHHPMENVGGCLGRFLNDEIDLWAPTSSPFRESEEIAEIFGVDPRRVRVRVPYVGGGFGSKTLTNSILATLFLSRQIGRPIRLIPTAELSFRQNARHAMVYKAKIGVKSDGTLAALKVDLVVDTGAYTTGAPTATHNAVISAWGCYRIPHVSIHARCAYTNKVPAGHTRATGKVQTTWGIECAIDSVARQMGIDPTEFRRKNVLLRGQFVAKGTPLMDTDYLDLMESAIAAMGWDGRSSLEQKTPVIRRGVARGKGMALSLRHGSQGGTKTSAMASVDASGVVRIEHNAPDLGQGVHNLISIIASKSLEIPQSRIVVGQPDTAVDLPFIGVHSQRTTMQMGNAVKITCENLKRELILTACRTMGGNPEEWRVVGGRLLHAEESYSFGDVARASGEDAVIQAVGHHAPRPTQKDSAFSGMDHWAPSAGAAEVEVDCETGELRVLRFSVVTDAGKALHHLSAKAQMDGGAVMGLGHALFEETVYGEGQMQNGDPFQYRLPVIADLPRSFYSSMMERGDGPGPFGSKGMSQTSIVTVAPAIGNAIFDAIGVRVRSLPITAEKILQALGKI